MFFSRLFLFAFSAIVALAPMPALSVVEGPSLSAVEESVLSKVEGPVLSMDKGVTTHAEGALVLNNDELAAPLKDSIPTPSLPAAIPVAAIPAPIIPSADASNITPAPTADASRAQNDLWQRIRNGFAMHDLDSPLIARHEQWYADRPDYVARMMERSQRYLFFITEEVEKRGMPTEIALLPMIESAARHRQRDQERFGLPAKTA